MTQSNNSKPGFRYDINALRAIAILGVLFYHYKVNFFFGGFAGVDVFFVISGYLMSKIIITSINRNEFSFKDYFGKRLKRIVPALLFLISAFVLIGFFIYLPQDYQTNQKNAAGSVAFLSNIWYWQNSNYFDASSETNIFLHTWSLSVEWQFYLLYPVVLLMLSRVFKSKLSYLLFFTISTILIFIFSVKFTGSKPVASFYLLPTRSWEMMFGGIAFLSEGLISSYRWRKTLAIVGYIVIIANFLLLRTYMPWPGIYTILPVFATFLVIIANYNDFKVIKHEIIQFVGKISYSLYLWHWPVYVVAQYFGIGINWQSIILFTIISVFLGYISFKYIESIRFISNKPIIAAMTILFISTASLSYFNANNVVFKPKTLEIANYRINHKNERAKQMSSGVCFLADINNIKKLDKEQCLCIEKNKKNILLIGDSHGAHLSQSLRERLEDKNMHLLQVTGSGGLPTLKSTRINGYNKLMKYVYSDFIVNNKNKIDGVIICANWVNAKTWNISPEELLNNINETITYLNKYHIKSIIIGQNEIYTIPYSTIAAQESQYNIRVSNKYLVKDAFEINNFLYKNLRPYYVNIINTNNTPPLSSDNVPYMDDENHYTKYGADIATDKMLSDPVIKGLFNQ